jgi:Tfp pilus assembly PilM family ATPase
MMGEYIFLTTEGSTFQPNSTSYEPDIENMQVIGFAEGDTVQDASRKLLELNEYLATTNFDEIFAIQLAGDHREYLSLRDVIQKYGGV